LESMKYRVQLSVLQAGCYGVPQNRWRVFVLAAKPPLPLPGRPLPLHLFPRTTVFNATSFRDCIVRPISDNRGMFDNFLPKVTVGQAIADLPPIKNGDGLEEVPYAGSATSPYLSLLRNGGTGTFDHICSGLDPVTIARVENLPRKLGAGWLDLPEHLRPKNL